MKLHELIKIQERGKKRLGRGIGSGKGKTAGRGTKGQKARGDIPIGFSGDLAFYKKLPRKKGAGNSKISVKPKLVKLSSLNVFKSRTVVSVNELLEAKIVSQEDLLKGVKILNEGEVEKPLTIKIPMSKNARQKVEKAGGKILND